MDCQQNSRFSSATGHGKPRPCAASLDGYGGRHLAAAATLEEAWRAARPDDIVERGERVKFFPPLRRKF